MRSIGSCVVALGVALAWAGCTPAAVVDEPASNLDVKFSVLDLDAAPSDGDIPVVASFTLNGALVKFGGNVAVTCNGTPLQFSELLGHGARVSQQAPGGIYTFAFTRNGTSTSVAVNVEARPVVLTPTSGQMIPAADPLTITYQKATSSGVEGSASTPAKGVLGNLQDDTGTYSNFTITGLTGPGSVSLTREFLKMISGSGFKSAASDYKAGSVDVSVTFN
jgi:hypothetical protein